MTYSIPQRMKRMRMTPNIRNMLSETRLDTNQFIAPLFISANINEKKAIASMPGQFQLDLNSLPKEIEEISNLNIPAVLLFGIPNDKNATGSSSVLEDGIVQQAIIKIRDINPDITIIADVCLCEYTDHGHCGVLQDQTIDNDKTLKVLSQQAISLADAGADWVAPSSMTDGMVGAIRQALDKSKHHDVSILSYAVKYSSSFYGPFRDAAEGSPKFGDRKTYQMNPANGQEAIREAALDLAEGADILMVKPAQSYLDVIYRIKQKFPEIPLCAYQVSGEYSMLKFAASNGLIDEEQAMIESLLAIKRAGSDLIISYFTKDIAKYLAKN
ncbi:MAG: porphobilinogen synthase [Legionellaceae bacterium]|nr:porphobilinogen synthase [Legionellaceae bacterium]